MCLTKASVFILALLFGCSNCISLAQVLKYKEKQSLVSLPAAIAATEAALTDSQAYAESPDGIKDGIPPLATADFDFKTVVDLKGGPSVNLFIFTLGATWDKQSTNDLAFQYAPHIAPESETFTFGSGPAPKSLYQSIVETLKASAKEIKKAQDTDPATPNKLDLCSLSLALSFGFTTDVQGGIKAPFQIVTVSASLDRSSQNVQQVKLTFKVKDPKNKYCGKAE
jgi:hypothetical protein